MVIVGDLNEKKTQKKEMVGEHLQRIVLMNNVNQKQNNQNKTLALQQQRLYLKSTAESNDISLFYHFSIVLTGVYWSLFMVTFLFMHDKLFKTLGTEEYEATIGCCALRELAIASVFFGLIIGGLYAFCKKRRA